MNQNWYYTRISNIAKEYANEVIAKNHFTSGLYTEKLENELAKIIGKKYCIYYNSGTSAITASCIALGLNRSKKIGIPGVGWIATAQAAVFCGAEVIVTDVQKDKPIVDIDSLENINFKFDAYIPVNYNGHQVDINKLREVLGNDTVIIEDSCKSFFSKGFNNNLYSGVLGDIGCFSTGMISMLPGIYGGIAVTDNLEIAKKLRRIKFHGVENNDGIDLYKDRSFNFKTSEINAAISFGMLDCVQERINRLNFIYSLYESGLRDLINFKLVKIDINKGELPLLIDIMVLERKKIIQILNNKNIPTCNYHSSLGNATYLSKLNQLPNSKRFADNVFHPPCGADQELPLIYKTIEEIRFIDTYI